MNKNEELKSFCENAKKIGGGGGGRVWGGQGECERRSKVIVKIQKKNMSGGQVRSGIGGGGGGRGVGVGRGGGGWLVAKLGVGGDVGYGGDMNQE